jgi:hypothetical protein
MSGTQARQDAIRAEPLTDNERQLAQTAFARDEQAAKWGNLVLAAYDGRVAELERVTAVPCRCDKCRDCLAADELERVTAALREIMHLECSAMGDAESDLQRCKEIARAALADLSASPETTP